jgi:putative Holliday junction resolvase
MPEGPRPPADLPRLALGLDYGERRIGVAAGHTLTGSAQPLGVVTAEAGRPDWRALERYVREWQPSLLVVGIPYNMDGTDGPLTERVREFCRELEARFRLEVSLVDERLSSREAEDRLRTSRASGERRRRVRHEDVDPIAACVLLEQWLRDGADHR